MELRHLRYFVAVGEEQHYNRAAQRLRVAQPALSRQIQDLEEEIGFKLLDRLPRGVKLSAAGKCFMEDARRILHQVMKRRRVPSASPPASRERCVSDSWKASPGMVWFQIRFGNFASDSRTRNCSSSLQAPLNIRKPFTPADWMPPLCSPLPISVANWSNLPSPPST